jgi:RNA polymerase primary sigma factor
MKEIQIRKNILNENSDTLKQYFKEINKYPILTTEQEIEIAHKAKEGNSKARDKLINSNLKFVITCAKQYTGQGVSLMDLIQAGNLGLTEAVERFDPDRGYKFLSFAVWYIRREMIKAIYNTGRTIRYPVTYITKITKVKKAYDEFLTKNQREPTDEELIKLTNLTQKQYNSTIIDKSYCQSLETPINEGNSTLEDLLTQDEVSFSDTFTVDSINKALNVLNPKERKVIEEYYGLNGVPERTIKEIAKEMGLGDERIRQLRKNSIKKLNSRQGNILKTLL